MLRENNGDLNLNMEQFLEFFSKLSEKEQNLKLAEMIYSLFEKFNSIKIEYRTVKDCNDKMQPEECLKRHNQVQEILDEQETKDTKKKNIKIDFYLKVGGLIMLLNSLTLLLFKYIK